MPGSTHLSLAYGLTCEDGLSQSDTLSQELKSEAGNAPTRSKKLKQAEPLRRQESQVKTYEVQP